jgi:hypothetical protein
MHYRTQQGYEPNRYLAVSSRPAGAKLHEGSMRNNLINNRITKLFSHEILKVHADSQKLKYGYKQI